MADTFKLKISTPTGSMLELAVEEVVLTTQKGQVGILPGHSHYVGLLGTGILSYREAGATNAKELVTCEGFCTFTGVGENAELQVLADIANLPGDDYSELDLQRTDFENIVNNNSSLSDEWKAAKQSFERLQALDLMNSKQSPLH